MMAISATGWGTSVSLITGLPYTLYTFEVNYCMRKWQISKRFSDFVALQKDLYTEAMVLPGVLRKDIMYKFQFKPKHSRADTLRR